MNNHLKNLLKKLSFIGLDVNYALDSGLSVAGLNLGRSKHRLAPRGSSALEYCFKFKPIDVLDVGSGGGEHASAFADAGANVTCVDFGTSIYAELASTRPNVEVVFSDFQLWRPSKKFDLVWASHVLEHQRNIGIFIDKLIECCADDGHIAITVPFPHRRLWGGHLSLWSPGLLAYNVVLSGIDLSSATLIYGYRETSLIFSPFKVKLPQLTFDSGDLTKLKLFLPKEFGENTDSWF